MLCTSSSYSKAFVNVRCGGCYVPEVVIASFLLMLGVVGVVYLK